MAKIFKLFLLKSSFTNSLLLLINVPSVGLEPTLCRF
jgi:hypothetical protein